ncbi:MULTISPECIES: PAAR domain-containing protein [Photorhabdus]|uniref:PAAR domain-containing protein n=2 Tax=Photorhabdus TaxID=29487 RepID=A0A0A0CL86_9GAMM|nr:PAAR domain-containing protein [Photorhabdus hindustanensis]KGM27096.1 PAAR repeat-containing protein [Photorhabdus luminescens]PQQ22075.1 PAAR domain-containing protein [Photorhabdus hindustanensis]PQQ22725.1 PAAR domain-containing protein [Photorhabdus luminescens]PQQ35519.1 PAAR domain-containing protein [Photorhabdus luminescens]
MSKAVILLGDTTDHGGKVITAIAQYTHNGIPIAGKEDLVACPQCKGVFPIIQGADSLTYKGKAIALEGMQTACGAKLIASQHEFTLAS